MPAVLQNHFAGQETVALVLRAEHLDAPVRYEDLSGHGLYPHLYGPLPARAVLREVPLSCPPSPEELARLSVAAGRGCSTREHPLSDPSALRIGGPSGSTISHS